MELTLLVLVIYLWVKNLPSDPTQDEINKKWEIDNENCKS